MNIQIQLVGELKDATMQTVLNVLADHNGCAPKKAAPAAAAKVQAETADGEEETEKQPAKSAAPAKKAAAGPAKPAGKAAAGPAAKKAAPAEEAVDFDEMDEEAQLAEITKVATGLSKKGKTADVKLLLGIYDAPRAGELDPAVYGEFYNLLTRYKAGETAEDLVEENQV